jgi:hypothetical protein
MQHNNTIRAPLEIFTAADVEPKEIDWLWYPYIPFGKLTLIHGDSGDGKSTFALNLAALLTRGDPLPLSGQCHGSMNVIYINAEDGLDDTVVPRFIKAGGVRERLIFISEEKQRLNFTDSRIRAAIEESGARALFFDPLASYLGADVAINHANEVRPRLEYLIEAARGTGCAIIVVAHMNKNEGMKAKARVNGSGDIVAAARSAVVIGRGTEDPDERVMAHSKSNLAPTGPSILFSIGDGTIDFIDTIGMTADQLVGAYGAGAPRETKQALASRKLQSMLSDGGIPQKEIMKAMSELGISQRTCELAKASLPIQSIRVGDHYVWVLGESKQGNNATMQGNTLLG